MTGPVEKYLLRRIQERGAIHLTLIDPEKVTVELATQVAQMAESCETTAIMVGGSTVVSSIHLDGVVRAIKGTVKIPVILFPNNVTGISRYADAILFMSLLNSADPYFINGVQILVAPLIKKLGLETLPLGYVIVGEGGTAGVVGRACPIPHDKPELAAAHALAAQYFGMRFVYMEAGSGAKMSVPAEMIRMVRNAVEIPVIVGGGIRTGEKVQELVKAGANAIVTGNVTEEGNMELKIKELINSTRAK